MNTTGEEHALGAKKTGLARLAAAAALFAAGAPALGQAEITAVRFGDHGERTRIVVEASAPLAFEAFTLADVSERLVIQTHAARWAVPSLPGGRGRGVGLAGAFRFADVGAEASRLVFELAEPALVTESFSLPPSGGGYRLVVDIEAVSADAFVEASGFPEADAFDQFIQQAVVRYVPPSCADIRIVIDPGHGGRDPGAPAQFGGGDEADVNLAAGLALRDILEATGRYTVLMTRDDDTYLELEERVRLARQAQADLFISLHSDAVEGSTSVRGASAYTLSGRAVGRARNRAIREGDWLVAEGPGAQAANDVLLDMSLREKRNQSLTFAEALLSAAAGVGPVLDPRPRERGFYVLLDSQVPAVLFEMGFMTNRQDAANLNDEAYRTRLMTAVAASIDQYFQRCSGFGELQTAGLSPLAGAARP